MGRFEDGRKKGDAIGMHASGEGASSDVAQSAASRDALAAALGELRAIARNIAGDAGLEVSLGQPNGGSYCSYGPAAMLRCDRARRQIVIDPLHLLDIGKGKFIIAHEGMHASVTCSPFDRQVYAALRNACDPKALYEEIGFASLLNFLEDCGGNDWLTRSYPAFEKPEQDLYDPMLIPENPEMHTPETELATARLGFFPRFAQFGSEVMKRWHTGSYSKELDPAVADALREQEGNNDRFIGLFPSTGTPTVAERDALYCRRFLVAADKIMPAIRKLVEMDKAQAGLQQMLNEKSKKGEQAKQPGQDPRNHPGQQQRQQGEEQSGQGQTGRQSAQESAQQGPSGEPQPTTSSQGGGAGDAQLSPQAEREIDEKTQAHREAQRESLQEQLDDLSKHLRGGDAQAHDSKDPTASKDPAGQIDEIRRKIEEQFDSPADSEAKNELTKHLDELEKLKDEIDSQAAPVDQLSEETRAELKRLYDQQGAGERQRLEQQGEELLKDFEDALRKQLEGQFQENSAPTHKQAREQKEQRAKSEREKQQAREATKKLEEFRRSQLSLWDAALEDVSGLVQKLYSRLERILRPAVPEWDSGHATGSRPNLLMTMQAKADRKLVNQMWEKKSLPVERDFVFSLLVDNSGSMAQGDKCEQARRCAVLLSEILTRLKVPFQITIFSEVSKVLKEFDERPSRGRKNEIGSSINGKGINGRAGTVDYEAVDSRVEAIGQRSEEHKFLIVITDGGSNNGAKLEESLSEALKRNVRVIGLGLGSETSDVDTYYPIGKGCLSLDPVDKGAALGPYFSKLLEEILKNPQQFVAKSLRSKSERKRMGT